ncbi:MAG: helix-hairpin-helix domain-containing protein [Bacteroidota bacterium]
MKQLNQIIRDYFGFSATELRGFWVLISLAIILLSAPILSKSVFRLSMKPKVVVEESVTLDSLIALLNPPVPNQEIIQPQYKTKTNYAKFDPNHASRDLLLQNGIPPWLADRLIKYRSKGGSFRKKEDILKIYGFPAGLYSQLQKYIELPKQVTSRPEVATVASPVNYNAKSDKRRQYSEEKVLEVININQADSSQLKKIPGIGSVLSARIIRFRDKLGGLHSRAQLQEVYQISDWAVQNLQKYTYIPPDNEVVRLNINSDDVKTLASHPYISYSLARAIIDHRKNYGNFSTVDDCREVYLMQDSIFQKITPYLGL